jgi:hypothetical protein
MGGIPTKFRSTQFPKMLYLGTTTPRSTRTSGSGNPALHSPRHTGSSFRSTQIRLHLISPLRRTIDLKSLAKERNMSTFCPPQTFRAPSFRLFPGERLGNHEPQVAFSGIGSSTESYEGQRWKPAASISKPMNGVVPQPCFNLSRTLGFTPPSPLFPPIPMKIIMLLAKNPAFAPRNKGLTCSQSAPLSKNTYSGNTVKESQIRNPHVDAAIGKLRPGRIPCLF